MTFKEWLDEPEGYALRVERLYADFEGVDRAGLLAWLEAAYEVGRDDGWNTAAAPTMRGW